MHGDRDRPAPVGPGAPDDDRDGERQADEERDRDGRPGPVATGDMDQDLDPFEPRPGHDHGRDRDDAAVAPSAIARFRHSRRTANQSRPMPGVTLVSRMSAQAAGQRKPTTMATASRSEMLPPDSSADGQQGPEGEQPRAGQEADGDEEDRGPDAHEDDPRQGCERRDELQEGRRVDVGAGLRPVRVGVRRVEVGRPVGDRLLARCPTGRRTAGPAARWPATPHRPRRARCPARWQARRIEPWQRGRERGQLGGQVGHRRGRVARSSSSASLGEAYGRAASRRPTWWDRSMYPVRTGHGCPD